MKIAVINFSGNVGKSTVARHLLAPRLPGADVIAIESINADEAVGAPAQTMRGQEFGELQEKLLSGGDVVVDVGASNVEDFVSLMTEFDGSHDDFDLFVVPTVSAAKQQRDTRATIDALAEIGVDPDRIRLVFNMVERDPKLDVARPFAPLFEYFRDTGVFTLRRDAVIYQSEIYTRAAEAGMSLEAIRSDDTDYKAEIARTTDPQEKLRLARLVAIRRLSVGVWAELDAVFDTLIA
jgi:hypothetical protein